MTIISQIIGKESGLQKRADVTSIFINLEEKFVQVCYNINLIGDSGNIIAPLQQGVNYVVRNIPAETDQDGKEITPANPKFDNLVASQVGQTISGMILQDLETLYK